MLLLRVCETDLLKFRFSGTIKNRGVSCGVVWAADERGEARLSLIPIRDHPRQSAADFFGLPITIFKEPLSSGGAGSRARSVRSLEPAFPIILSLLKLKAAGFICALVLQDHLIIPQESHKLAFSIRIGPQRESRPPVLFH